MLASKPTSGLSFSAMMVRDWSGRYSVRPAQRFEVLLVVLDLLELQLVVGGLEPIRRVEPRPAAPGWQSIALAHGST